MLILIGYAVLCLIALSFWVAAGFWLSLAIVFKAGETVVMGLIMLVLAFGFSYAVWCQYPFNPITLKIGG